MNPSGIVITDCGFFPEPYEASQDRWDPTVIKCIRKEKTSLIGAHKVQMHKRER